MYVFENEPKVLYCFETFPRIYYKGKKNSFVDFGFLTEQKNAIFELFYILDFTPCSKGLLSS